MEKALTKCQSPHHHQSPVAVANVCSVTVTTAAPPITAASVVTAAVGGGGGGGSGLGRYVGTRLSSSSPSSPKSPTVSSVILSQNTLATQHNTRVLPCNSTDATVISDAAAASSASQQIKNKRKNFNPRCSASADEETYDQLSDISAANKNVIIDKMKLFATTLNDIQRNKMKMLSISNDAHYKLNTDSKKVQSEFQQTINTDPQIIFDTMSINWRKFLEDQTQPTQNELRSDPPTTSNCDNNSFYNIPNTNFSIAKSAFGLTTAAVEAAATGSTTVAAAATKSISAITVPPPTTSVKTVVAEECDVDSSAELTSMTSSAWQAKLNDASSNSKQLLTKADTPSDPKAHFEFACNAFNAVQELLNVYGLSLSPGDIVDAFRRKAVGKFFFSFLYII